MRTSEREKKYLCISPGWRTPASLELAGRESRAIEEGGGGGGVIVCMRFGSTACTLGSVDVSTVAWLSASICQFVFMFEGFSEALLTATATCNSWSFAAERYCCLAAVGHEVPKRR